VQKDSALDLFCDYLATERRVSSKTISAYLSDIKHYFQFAPEHDWSTTHALNTYLVGLETECATVWRRRSALIQFCKFLHDEEIITDFNPQKIYKPKLPQKLPKALTKDQIHMLLQHFANDQTNGGIRKYAFVAIMYATGSRVSECAQIKLADIHSTKILVTGKRGKSRWVFLNNEAQVALQRYIDVRAQWARVNNPYLWASGKGYVLRQTVHKWLKGAGQSLGFEISPHVLRHTQATQLLPHVNIVDLSRILGHASIDTTSIYLRVAPQDLRDTLEHYHPLADDKK
jgi:site-specific recombinase XerD